MMLTARKKTRIAWWAGLFLVPSLLLYASLVIVPIGVAMVLSLFDWDGSGPMEFIGLGNWATFVSDSDAMATMQRTGVLLAASWLVELRYALVPLVLWLAFREHRGRAIEWATLALWLALAVWLFSGMIAVRFFL